MKATDFLKQPPDPVSDALSVAYSIRNPQEEIHEIGDVRFKITSYEDDQGTRHESVSVEHERMVWVFGPQGQIPERYWTLVFDKTPAWVRQKTQEWQKAKLEAIAKISHT